MTLYQNDEDFPPEIQSGGCHLLSFLFILEKKEVINISHEFVRSIYEFFKTKNICTWESYVIYPNKLLDHFAPGRFEYIMRTNDVREGDECLALYEWSERKLKHFVVQRPGEPIEYDPTEGGCVTVEHGVLRNVRVIRERSNRPILVPTFAVDYRETQAFAG